MSETVDPTAAPAPVVMTATLGPRFDLTVLLKYASSGVLMGMLFALVVLGKMSPDAFETLAVGALGALGGHAAGAFGKSSPP